tara:strand:- start:487 stop:654 length:168 start_codon:yes stop_codon:yes gene_type:complete
MDEIQEQVERLIEEIENDSNITTVEIAEALYKLKTEIEEHILQREDRSLQWTDLD